MPGQAATISISGELQSLILSYYVFLYHLDISIKQFRMKKTAHGNPIHISNGKSITLIKDEGFSEKQLQDLIFDHPNCLPISDIDESYNPIISICKELRTTAGPLDLFMSTPNGDLAIIETKLWYNPEARRKVVAQILDYAKELSKWSYSDLQREINKNLKSKGNSLYKITAKKHPENILSEIDFVDAVSRNLRLGKILLLIVGDGIREGTKGITEYLNKSTNFHFTMGIVEMPMFRINENEILIFPRTTLKTVEIQKINIEVQEGFKIVEASHEENPESKELNISKELIERRIFFMNFWTKYIKQLSFDDPEQSVPNPTKTQNLYIYPGIDKSSWISAYFAQSIKRVGVYYKFGSSQNAQVLKEKLSPYLEDIKIELGNQVHWSWDDGKNSAFDIVLPIEDVYDLKNELKIIDFFNHWVNSFVNIMRPKLKLIE